MIVIVCTGTPGTGKTALAKKLANDLKYDYVDVNKVIDDNKLIEEYDEKRNTYVVDEEKLSKILIIMIESGKNLVIDSHLAHYVPKANVDYCSIHHKCPYCGMGYSLMIDFSPTNENVKREPTVKLEKEDKNYIG